MKILDRYLRNAVLTSFFLVLMIIVGLDSLSAFLAELEDLEHNYQLKEALNFVLWTLPRRLVEFVPVATLIGCLMGLGFLANNSELIVMRTAGVSVRRIVWGVLQPTLLILLLSGLLSEIVVPYTEQVANSERALLKGGQSSLRSGKGLWHREGNEILHISAVSPSGSLYGVSRYVFDDAGHLLRSSYSEQAHFENGQWQLTDSKVTELFESHTQRQQLQSDNWSLKLRPENVLLASADAEFLNVLALYHYAVYLEEQALNASQYFLAFWKKLFKPLVTVAMVLIAVSFVFGPLRSVSMSFRVLVGVVVGLVFQQAQDFFAYASLVFNINPLLAIVIPVFVCASVGLFMLSRVR
ncbi:MAG TPA: LPS export ABC transporter permease LptG [Pseudomonadales bacterium]|nr:LPS export ABC transporter permease LptG [Pseudomonadales bacterium]